MSAKTRYVTVNLSLSKRQLGLLKNALENMTGCTLVLAHHQLEDGIDTILTTPAQSAKILAAKSAGNPITIKLSAKCVAAMREQVGNGILDSLGSIFNSVKTTAIGAANSVKNAASSAWRNVTARPELAPRVRAPVKAPVKVWDRGQEYDGIPTNFTAPKRSGFDKIADKVQNFDEGINKFFNYPSNSGVRAWKQQKAGFTPYSEDF